VLVEPEARSATLVVRIAQITRETDEILKFVLVDPDGGALPGFAAGAHVDVHVAPGLTRQYSLLNPPGEGRQYVIAVKREPQSRGGSVAMHGGLAPGDLVRIGSPRNGFGLDHGAAHHLLIAGGIGITPLLGMAGQLAATGGAYTLAYFVRAPELAGFAEELGPIMRAGRLQLHAGLNAEATVAAVAGLLARQPEGTHVYACGPRPLMDAAEELARACGRDLPVHREDFAALPLVAGSELATFGVQLAQSGGTLPIPPERTIADVLIEHGVALDTSCEQGMCGTCLTRVLGGVPEHRDTFLSEDERASGQHILPCVSRSRTPLLVLDL
jgi:vanillate O-demethylase ferredoxin subunit